MKLIASPVAHGFLLTRWRQSLPEASVNGNVFPELRRFTAFGIAFKGGKIVVIAGKLRS